MQEKFEAKEHFWMRESNLMPFACKSENALRLREEQEDIRTPFFHDADRILYDLSYVRYQDKTQVFQEKINDHISKRMIHVQMVSKIARTIGRSLALNEDLIEAIALGHDIGHAPLGHAGEEMLNKIAQEELQENFAHNVQSVRYYMEIAQHGNGLNLSLQTLDGILMHNGELLSEVYAPIKKTKEKFLEEYHQALKDAKTLEDTRPMTLEGCVVRLSDVIGYIGRDIEDAILLGRLKEEDIPKEIRDVLGTTNREIINTLVLDIVKESMGKPYIQLSKKVYQALFKLKEINMEKIYRKAMTKEEYNNYEKGMRELYKHYKNDLLQENKDSLIYQDFLIQQDEIYIQNTSIQRKVIDFIAGMTDAYFLRQIKNLKKS